jgi:hypothetical protein
MGCLLLKFGVDSLSAPKNNGTSKLSGLPFSDHCKTPYTEKAEGSNDIQKPDKWFNMTKKEGARAHPPPSLISFCVSETRLNGMPYPITDGRRHFQR